MVQNAVDLIKSAHRKVEFFTAKDGQRHLDPSMRNTSMNK